MVGKQGKLFVVDPLTLTYQVMSNMLSEHMALFTLRNHVFAIKVPANGVDMRFFSLNVLNGSIEITPMGDSIQVPQSMQLGTVDYYLRERKSSRNLPKNYNAAVVL